MDNVQSDMKELGAIITGIASKLTKLPNTSGSMPFAHRHHCSQTRNASCKRTSSATLTMHREWYRRSCSLTATSRAATPSTTSRLSLCSYVNPLPHDSSAS